MPPLTIIDVIDTAIKIGLGSVITAISGCVVLRMTQKHEIKKEAKANFYKRQEERKNKLTEFLSQSQCIVQDYLHTICNCQGEDYKSYIRAYNEVQIISSDTIRLASSNLLSSVNEFIIYDHNRADDLSKKMRKAVNDNVGKLQKIAQDDVTKEYKEN